MDVAAAGGDGGEGRPGSRRHGEGGGAVREGRHGRVVGARVGDETLLPWYLDRG